jgi:hypothetical protein
MLLIFYCLQYFFEFFISKKIMNAVDLLSYQNMQRFEAFNDL